MLGPPSWALTMSPQQKAGSKEREGCKQGEGLANVCRAALPSKTHHSKLEEKGEKEETLKRLTQGFFTH